VLRFILQKRKQGGNGLLALAQNKAEGLPILHHVNEEVQGVAALYGARPLLGKDATESALRARAGEYDILHIAAHGQLDPLNPLFSHIVLSSDKGNDGLLEVRDVYRLNLARTSMVVLSACNTQLGAQKRGDDIVALNRAFIYAGAPTVISSLWTVDDDATGELMLSFYRHLRRGMSKADALRAAQQETRAHHPHPYYWAGFVLAGDPGVNLSNGSRANTRRR
jgi:CHAT domain-containing protein